MRELLLAASGEVLQSGVIFHDPGKHLEIGDPARKGVVGSLENISRRRFRILDTALSSMAIAGNLRRSLDSAMLSRRGTVINNKVQQMVSTNVAQSRGKDYGKDFVVANGLMQCRNQMLLRNSAGVEELFHQLILAFGNNLHQLFMGFFANRFNVAGNRAFFPLSIAAQ